MLCTWDQVNYHQEFFFQQIALYLNSPKINYLSSEFLSWANACYLVNLNKTTFLAPTDHYSASHGDQEMFLQYLILTTAEKDITVQAHCYGFYYVLVWWKSYSQQGQKNGRRNSDSQSMQLMSLLLLLSSRWMYTDTLVEVFIVMLYHRNKDVQWKKYPAFLFSRHVPHTKPRLAVGSLLTFEGIRFHVHCIPCARVFLFS